MRRDEFKIEDKKIIENILFECKYGVLSLIDDTFPYSIPLNFVYFENSICFHGSKQGKKMRVIGKNPNASFVATIPYSFIPSYFSDEKSACPASQFFASIIANGRVKEIFDLNLKSNILNALMQKMQKEGGYENISAQNGLYKNSLKSTSVLALEIDLISCKVKLGQNLSDEKFDNLLQKLENRSLQEDKKSIMLMKMIKNSSD